MDLFLLGIPLRGVLRGLVGFAEAAGRFTVWLGEEGGDVGRGKGLDVLVLEPGAARARERSASREKARDVQVAGGEELAAVQVRVLPRPCLEDVARQGLGVGNLSLCQLQVSTRRHPNAPGQLRGTVSTRHSAQRAVLTPGRVSPETGEDDVADVKLVVCGGLGGGGPGPGRGLLCGGGLVVAGGGGRHGRWGGGGAVDGR